MKLKKNKTSLITSLLKKNYIPITIGLFFFIAYSVLSLVKHYSFLSGYDLGIIDQAIWKYSRLINPISTTHVYFDAPIYYDHLEIILVILSPIYWIVNSVIALIVLQVIAILTSGAAVLFLAKHYKLNNFVSNCIFGCYLAFFGLQFAVWSDVHTLVFGVAFLSWYLYFLSTKKTKLTYLFLLLAILCKEDIALLTLLIGCTYFIFNKSKTPVITGAISLAYLLFLFLIYFPNVVPGGYHFANPNGLMSDLNPYYFIDSVEKQKTLLYSIGWFGFLPLLSFIYTIPFLGDLAHYFVLGHVAVRTEGIFLHYRSSVGLLLVWPTIIAISKYKQLNNWKIGLYLVFCAMLLQYYLHLPLSYLTKKWFWNLPPETSNIYYILETIPKDAAIVTQNNIAPHLTHRDQIYTLFPSVRDFTKNSPCGVVGCRWFRVGGDPKLLLVDIGPSWNILNLLGTREDFLDGITNLEKNGNIVLLSQKNSAKLYRVIKKI